MKKIIPLCVISFALSGCIWPAVEGAGAVGYPYDAPQAFQPKYEYETYKPYKTDAVEQLAIDGDPEYYKNQMSYKTQEALRASIINAKRKYPNIFKNNKSFLVGAFVDVDNINKSEKAGRITAMGLTNIIGKTSEAKYIRYKRDMIAVNNRMVVPTAEATKAAEKFKTDALVMGIYKVNANNINIRYAFYDAKTRAYLGEETVLIPLDRKSSEFAFDI